MTISNFGNKLNLLLKSGKTKFAKSSDLSKQLNITGDYFSRMKGGSRQPSENVFATIVELTKDSGVSSHDWYGTLENFGNKLGYSLHDIQRITGASSIGLDFHSRSRDSNNIHSIYNVIEGYWEAFYYSVSTFDKPQISHDLVIIKGIDESNFIKCKLLDSSFTYTGHCFPIHGSHLYFMLEKEIIFDEIIVYMMNRPERSKDPVLDGVMICTSGGVQDKVSVPCAARVSFRYLGKTYEQICQNIPEFNKNDGEELEDALQRQIPGYICPKTITPDHKRYWEVKNSIDNTIHANQIPFALRMERETKK